MGVTYSPRYAASLGLDPRHTYERMLDELNVRDVRLAMYWDEIERSPGTYDLSEVELYMAEGERRAASGSFRCSATRCPAGRSVTLLPGRTT